MNSKTLPSMGTCLLRLKKFWTRPAQRRGGQITGRSGVSRALAEQDFSSTAVVVSLLALLAGCGETPPQFGEVEGVLYVRGQPQPNMTIRFMPDPAKGNDVAANASGTTDAQGRYQLQSTFKGKDFQGAAVGWHKVLVEDPRLSALPQGQARPPEIVPRTYGNPATTKLSKEVKPGQQTIDLKID